MVCKHWFLHSLDSHISQAQVMLTAEMEAVEGPKGQLPTP